MKFVNIWLALSNAAQDIVLESINWDEETQGAYDGPLRPMSRLLFSYMDDQATRRRLFEKASLQGTIYNLWTIEFTDQKSTLQHIGIELDYLMEEYPNQIAVCGAWDWQGDQIGDPIRYPLPDWLWKFLPDPMPGTVTQENPDGYTATSNDDLIDVNLLQGQSPRVFIIEVPE